MSRTFFRVLPPTLEAHQRELEHCAACPKLCRHTCPVAEVEQRESVTPWALMSAGYMASKGLPTLRGEDAGLLWHCSGCRACQGACKFDHDVPGALHALRAERYLSGEAPARARSAVERFQARGGNLYRADLNQVPAQMLSAERLKAEAPEVVFVDCTLAARYPELVPQVARVLDAVGLTEVGFLSGGEACCGLPLLEAGDMAGFVAHARKVAAGLSGRRRVYASSPGCAQALREVYASVGVELSCEVLPLLDAVTVRLERVRARGGAPGVAALHHPCQLSRGLGRSEALTALVTKALGQPPREALRTGTETSCSGGGGGLPLFLPEVAAGVARQCVERLGVGEGELTVTACSACRRQLEKAGANVKDVFAILAENLEE